MDIIIVNKKSEFTKDQIWEMEGGGTVNFIEDAEGWKNIKASNKETVLALDPSITDWKVDNTVLDKFPNLKGVCLPTTAYEWVDGEYLKKRDIPLTSVPKYSTEAVAEHSIMLMLALAKKLPMIIENNWELDYDRHLGADIKGKFMGIIGLGAIGTRVAELGQAMGLDVKYYSPNTKDERFEYVEIDELVKSSDFILLTLICGDETENFLSEERIKELKPSACIINTSGDSVIDLGYAIKALKNNKIGGLAIENEKLNVRDKNLNLLITPHMAWYTKESFEEDFRIWTKSILSIIDGNPINVVN